MIRYFCDCCGEEIAERYTKDRNPLHRLTATLKKGNSKLAVEVIETLDGVSNAGQFCRYCVLDALASLDDRPTCTADPVAVMVKDDRYEVTMNDGRRVTLWRTAQAA